MSVLEPRKGIMADFDALSQARVREYLSPVDFNRHQPVSDIEFCKAKY
jgi:hypothetical protein